MDRIDRLPIWSGLLVGLLLFIPFWYLLEIRLSFEIMNSVLMGCGLATCWALASEVVKIVRLGVHEAIRAEVLIVGLFLMGLGVVEVFGTQWLWRALGKPEWLEDHWILGLGRWTMIGSVVIIMSAFLTKPGAMVGAQAYWKSGLVVGVSVVIACSAYASGI